MGPLASQQYQNFRVQRHSFDCPTDPRTLRADLTMANLEQSLDSSRVRMIDIFRSWPSWNSNPWSPLTTACRQALNHAWFCWFGLWHESGLETQIVSSFAGCCVCPSHRVSLTNPFGWTNDRSGFNLAWAEAHWRPFL